MARDDSQDQEMERVLQGYFASERPGVRAPDDLWQRLESRLGEQSDPSRLSAIGDKIFPRTGRLWSPVVATAGVAAVAVVATVSVWAATGGFSGGEPQEELVSRGERGATATAVGTPAATPGPSPSTAEAPDAMAIVPAEAMTEAAPPAPAEASQQAAAPAMEAAPSPLPTTAPASTIMPMSEEAEGAMGDAGASAPEATLSLLPTAAPASARASGALAEPEAAFDLLIPQVGSPPDTVFKDYGRLSFRGRH